ncbi:hypothetical protein L1887_60508 [Cichorium endivia]|nr:hypothetical protein L1887_60508 [Cichorium endivia]
MGRARLHSPSNNGVKGYFQISFPVGMKDEAKNVPHLPRQKLSRQAKINLDYRPASPEPASGSLLAKRMLVSLSHDQTNGVKDEKEERGKMRHSIMI